MHAQQDIQQGELFNFTPEPRKQDAWGRWLKIPRYELRSFEDTLTMATVEFEKAEVYKGRKYLDYEPKKGQH